MPEGPDSSSLASWPTTRRYTRAQWPPQCLARAGHNPADYLISWLSPLCAIFPPEPPVGYCAESNEAGFN
jgi:hypothetical protein